METINFRDTLWKICLPVTTWTGAVRVQRQHELLLGGLLTKLCKISVLDITLLCIKDPTSVIDSSESETHHNEAAEDGLNSANIPLLGQHDSIKINPEPWCRKHRSYSLDASLWCDTKIFLWHFQIFSNDEEWQWSNAMAVMKMMKK